MRFPLGALPSAQAPGGDSSGLLAAPGVLGGLGASDTRRPRDLVFHGLGGDRTLRREGKTRRLTRPGYARPDSTLPAAGVPVEAQVANLRKACSPFFLPDELVAQVIAHDAELCAAMPVTQQNALRMLDRGRDGECALVYAGGVLGNELFGLSIAKEDRVSFTTTARVTMLPFLTSKTPVAQIETSRIRPHLEYSPVFAVRNASSISVLAVPGQDDPLDISDSEWFPVRLLQVVPLPANGEVQDMQFCTAGVAELAAVDSQDRILRWHAARPDTLGIKQFGSDPQKCKRWLRYGIHPRSVLVASESSVRRVDFRSPEFDTIASRARRRGLITAFNTQGACFYAADAVAVEVYDQRYTAAPVAAWQHEFTGSPPLFLDVSRKGDIAFTTAWNHEQSITWTHDRNIRVARPRRTDHVADKVGHAAVVDNGVHMFELAGNGEIAYTRLSCGESGAVAVCMDVDSVTEAVVEPIEYAGRGRDAAPTADDGEYRKVKKVADFSGLIEFENWLVAEELAAPRAVQVDEPALAQAVASLKSKYAGAATTLQDVLEALVPQHDTNRIAPPFLAHAFDVTAFASRCHGFAREDAAACVVPGANPSQSVAKQLERAFKSGPGDSRALKAISDRLTLESSVSRHAAPQKETPHSIASRLRSTAPIPLSEHALALHAQWGRMEVETAGDDGAPPPPARLSRAQLELSQKTADEYLAMMTQDAGYVVESEDDQQQARAVQSQPVVGSSSAAVGASATPAHRASTSAAGSAKKKKRRSGF